MKKQVVIEEIKRHNPDFNFGLTHEQVEDRIKNGLTNKKKKKYSKSYLRIFLDNFCTFFNLLGLIVCLALVYAGATIGNFFFVIIYIANIIIGIVQEIRAKLCIDRLSIVSNKQTHVLRNGEFINICSSEIVLDDIIIFKSGNQVSCDCIIQDGFVEVNESFLTGESVAVKKNAGDVLLSGSFITSGTCKAKADKISSDCYVEQLSAKAKTYKKPHSELMSSLHAIIKIVGIIIVPIALSQILKSGLLSAGIKNTILTTSASIIGMIPSGMFLLTSLTLAVGIIKLAKHNTLVQDLYSLEMLARVDTICFDKTGTITDGNMTVKEVVSLNKLSEDEISKIISSMLNALDGDNQTVKALEAKFGREKFYNSTEILPFNSSRKLSAVSFDSGLTYSFGAPEFVLSKANYEHISELVDDYAKSGLRVLVLAKSTKPLNENYIPSEFRPIALLTIIDNIREDAKETVEWFQSNGVQIKVISGDNPITVAEVSKRAGILNTEKYISLEGMSEQEVYSCATEYTVFGRVSPEQKAIIIKALKDDGHVTAMTGDGVNDILALKEADCAISVASGSEAARNISHLVLMNNNFNSMPNVVYEGRRVINNVQSSASLYIMKTLFTILLTVLTLFIPVFETYPFTPDNMILLEVFVIGVPSFFLSMQTNTAKVEGRFITTVLEKSLPGAILMVLSVFCIQIFKESLGTFPAEVYTTMSVIALTYSGLISLYTICLPFNLFRVMLFFMNFTVITIVSLYALSFGLPILGLVKLSPFTEYWHHILIVLLLLFIEIPINYLVKLMCNKIRFGDRLLKRIK